MVCKSKLKQDETVMGTNRTKLLVTTGLFTALTAAGAFIKIPFYPVPFTLQSFFTGFAGVVLPPYWAFLSQMLYLLLGLLGLPIFAQGGGLGYVLQPTFGYLLMLPLSAFLISFHIHFAKHKTLILSFLIIVAGLVIILIGGTLGLTFHFRFIMPAPIKITTILKSGVLLFLPAAILKSFVSVSYTHLRAHET